ncbi:MAG: hypothetical protein IJN67_11635 [Oscillospiraceae bacterium]|nr:hypothetical protein [Oscillospiraceae bacterium]
MDKDILVALIGLLGTIITGLSVIIASFHSTDSVKEHPSQTPPHLWLRTFLSISCLIFLFATIISILNVFTHRGGPDVNTPSTSETLPTSTEDKTTIATVYIETSFKDKLPGDIIEFGKYKAQGDHAGQEEPITWIVLENDGSKILALSEKGLDTIPYHSEDSSVTWDNCRIRSWLNDYFFEEAFTENDKAQIIHSPIIPERVWDCHPGEETTDYVFLLSHGDITEYIVENPYFHNPTDILKCFPSTSAKTQNIYTSNDGTCWWWLRNTTRNNTTVYRVVYDGTIDTYGHKPSTPQSAVRPAIWISIT